MESARHEARERGLTDEDICALLDARIKDGGVLRQRLIEVRDTYNGDIVIPLPEMDEMEKPAVANLLSVGLDGTAERIASTVPNIFFPDDGDGDTALARKRARQRTDVVTSWWDLSALDLHLYRRARHYGGYGRFISFIRPSAKYGAPCYELRDPLTAYPSDEYSLDMTTADCIFTFKRSGAWVCGQYGDAEARLKAMLGDRYREAMLEIVEYVSDDEWIILARIDPSAEYLQYTASGRREHIRLARIPNRIERCPIVLGGRFGLDRVAGQFDSMAGIYWTQAKLQALETIAVTRDIFPDLVAIGQNGQNPQWIVEPDGLRGQIGELRNGDVKVIQGNPGYMTAGTIDRLERNSRVAGRIPAEFGGESGTNIRTGKRGDAVISATVDFVVQEAQRIMQRALREENRIAIAIDKAYYGDQQKFIYLGSTDTKKRDSYTPNKLWTTDRHEVMYTHAGSDANSLTIGLLQLLGANVMSRDTVMRKHPMIDDPEREHDRLQMETLEAALLGSIATMTSQGQLPPGDVARIMQLIKNDKVELADAILQAQAEAQERQAQQVQPQDPAAQPGLAVPGAGAEASTVPPVAPGMRNLQSLLGATRLINMRTGPEMQQAGNLSTGV